MKFYELKAKQRREILKNEGYDLVKVDKKLLKKVDSLSENVIGTLTLPLSIVPKIIVNGQNYQVPMSTEEPSVVAAANHGSSIFNLNNGVQATSLRNGIWGQIVLRVSNDFDLELFKSKFAIYLDLLNHEFNSLIGHGGSIKQIKASQNNDLLKILVLVDPAQAMGANRVNTILEYFANYLVDEKNIDEKLFAILSNYPTQIAKAKVELKFETLTKSAKKTIGRKIAQKIVLLSDIGQSDVFRSVTNNKGIMNGVDAVLLATGNDYRAVDSAISIYVQRHASLTKWYVAGEKLIGEIELPLPIGVVGGSISVRPDILQNYNLIDKTQRISVETLSEIIASIGLANNFAALNAIATSGIQAGHMKLQARNVVNTLKATDKQKEQIYQELLKFKKYNVSFAQDLLAKIKENEDDN